MADLTKYVVHTYTRDGGIHWHVAGRLVEVIVKPPLDQQESSLYLTAADLGLKNKVLAQMRTWTHQWCIQNGREDPRAEFHSAGYIQAKTYVEQLSPIIDAAVKKYYARQ